MADATEVMKRIVRKPQISYPVLVPNAKGLEKAIEAGAKEFAIFLSASETFSEKNINCSIDESFQRYKEVTNMVKKLEEKDKDYRIRGYVSCVMGCPYEGDVKVEKVVDVSRRLYSELGCYEISLGDTIGVGSAGRTFDLFSELLKYIPCGALAIHAHDTYGQALANILAALQLGIHVVDSSVSGIGGCPYAKGASGNVATEEVVYMLHSLGIKTEVDLEKLIKVGAFISEVLGRPSQSKVATATRNLFSFFANF